MGRGENTENDWARGAELANGREVKYTFSNFTTIAIDYTDGSYVRIDRGLRGDPDKVFDSAESE